MSAATKLRERLREPPPGPFRPTFWRSPLRGPWLTSLLGTLLIPAILIMVLTGLISHDAYHPELGRNALKVVRENLGAIDRTTDMIVKRLDNGEIYIKR